MNNDIQGLFNSAIAGDKAAENKLFSDLHARFLSIAQHRICNPQIAADETKKNAEDIVQETLEIVFKNYKQIEYKSGFVQYAFGVLRNKVGDYFRKKERQEAMKVSYTEDEFADEENLTNNIEANELREFIISSLFKFSFESQRIVLTLLEGYTTSGTTGAIIKLLGNIPRGTLDSKLHRIRKKLKKILIKRGYDE